jgi:hypothetical protein
MNRARLIKRGSTSEQKSPQTITLMPAAKMTVKVVKEWLTERRAAQQTEARQAFAELFT